MKKIGEDIKKMLSGLSYQNSGGCLSRKEKLVVLGHEAARQGTGNAVYLKPETQVVDAQKADAPKKSAA